MGNDKDQVSEYAASRLLSGPDLTSDVVFNRRKWLQTIGLGLATPTLTGTAMGQDGDIEPNVTFEDQTSDGSTVVIAKVATPVNADLIIYDKDSNTRGSENFSAGTVQTDVEVTLNRQELSNSRQLQARFYESDGPSSPTRPDSAYIAVDEPVPTRIDTLVEADSDAGSVAF
jgi:hypothetical protein